MIKTFKITILILFSLALFSSCKLIDGWTHFEVEYYSSVTLPQDLDVNQSKDVYPDQIAAELEKEVKKEGYDLDKIEGIELTDVILTIEYPAGVDFSFLSSAELYMSAAGIPEKKVAWKDQVPAGIGNSLKMKTTSSNLKKYIKQDVVSLRLNIIANTGIATDYFVGIDTEFLVDIKILGI